MSPSGLRKILDGAEPYSATRRKLQRWYVRERASDYRGLQPAEALAALYVLLGDLPASERGTALASILPAVRNAYLRARGRIPDWVERVEARGDAD